MKNKIIVLLIALMGFGPLIAQEALTIDLDKAVSMAKSNNIDFKRAALKLKGDRDDKNSAYNVFIPKLSGTAAISKSNTEPASVQIGDGVYFEPSDTNLSVGYKTNFTFTPALFSGISILNRKYELGEITFAQAVVEMENGVKEFFYNIILLREQKALLEDNLKTLQSRYDLTKMNYDAGLVSELELLKVQVSLENFKPELNKVKNGYDAALLNFKTLLGVDLNQEVIIEGEINPEIVKLTIDEAYDLALANNLTLRTVNKSVELFKAQKSAAFSRSFIPMVDFSYNYNRILNDPFGDDRLKEENFLDDTGSFTVALIYSFDSLFPGSKERMEVKGLDRKVLDLNLQRSALVDGLKVQVTNSINSLNNSLKMQKGLELTVDLARKTLEKVEVAYKAGTAQLLEVENAENEYKKARVELLREKFNYTMTSMKLNTIISAQ